MSSGMSYMQVLRAPALVAGIIGAQAHYFDKSLQLSGCELKQTMMWPCIVTIMTFVEQISLACSAMYTCYAHTAM